MDERLWLAERFEEHRPRLRAIAFRMLGSVSEADDVLQETWLRVTRADPSAVENMAGWLTTIVARMALNQLRSRRRRREERFADSLPEPVIDRPDGIDPEHAAVLADSVGLAMLVVLETLTPAERLAFVLHDTFGVPFDDIAPIVDRTPTAARQLASRARRRIRSQPIVPDTDLRRQREVVDAFQAAARDGDFEGLVRVLDQRPWCAPTGAPGIPGPARSGVPAKLPARRWTTLGRSAAGSSRRWSTGERACSSSWAGASGPSWNSPSITAGSSQSTSSATRSGSRG
jgi:RNA polymerase sigma factor (sigma-70 family)